MMVKIVTLTKEPPQGFENACAVYRFDGGNGEFLYVGATRDPKKRIAQHATTSKWFAMAEKVFVSWYKTKEAALNAEAKAIFEGKPMFNKTCAITRVSDVYRVRTRVRVFRDKKEKPKVQVEREVVLKPVSSASNAVKQWCKEGGRKLGWLAEQVPVPQSTLSRWLNSKAMPSTVYRIRLSHITGIDDLRDAENWINKEALA